MKIYFVALALGAVFFSLSGAVLSWDGSYVFYRVIGDGIPFVIHFRYFTVPAHVIAILASNFTDNIYVLQLTFSFYYVTIPLFSSYLSWRIVRDQHPDLFVWCAIGTGLVVILGQMLFVFEAMLILHLFWPLWFAVLLGGKSWHIWVILISVILLPFLHPYASGLIAYALLGWIVFHYRHKMMNSRRLWIVSALMVASIVLAALFVVFDTNPFIKTQSLSPRLVLSAFYRLNPLAMVNLVLVAALAIALYMQSRSLRQDGQIAPAYLPQAIIGITILCGVFLFFWASDVNAWWNTVTYRSISFFTVSPIYLFAFLQVHLTKNAPATQIQREWRLHRPVIAITGIIFAMVALLLSWGWIDLSNQLDSEIDQRAATCIPTDVVDDALGRTALTHWSVIPYSLVRQGQNPEYVIQGAENCSPEALANGFAIAEWEQYHWGDDVEWFNFDNLQSILTE